VPPAGADTVALEEYVVETAEGNRIGKVVALLERDDDVYLAVERGTPPVHHDVRVFPLEEVEGVDHEGLLVRLRVEQAAVENSVELDPDKGVEDGQAEARRVTSLPDRLTPSAPPASGPVDRPAYGAALGLGALGLLTLLAAIILVGKADTPWRFVALAVPATILAFAGVVAYRLFRNPYERPQD